MRNMGRAEIILKTPHNRIEAKQKALVFDTKRDKSPNLFWQEAFISQALLNLPFVSIAVYLQYLSRIQIINEKPIVY